MQVATNPTFLKSVVGVLESHDGGGAVTITVGYTLIGGLFTPHQVSQLMARTPYERGYDMAGATTGSHVVSIPARMGQQ